MLRPRINRPLLVLIGFAAFLLACYPEDLLPRVTVTPVPVVQEVSTSTSEPTSAVALVTTAAAAAPTEDIRPGVDAVTRALEAGDARVLSDLLIDQVWLAQGPNGDQGASITRNQAVQWLNARWGRQRTVNSSDLVQHFVLLEIKTSGWAPVAPMQSGLITFNLHRYNAQGQADPQQGTWRIDAILYQ